MSQNFELPSIVVSGEFSKMETVSKEFASAYSEILEIIRGNFSIENIPDVNELIEKLMGTHVASRKTTSGEAMVHFYRNIKPERSPAEDRRSYVLGWCIEIIVAARNVEDKMVVGLNQLEHTASTSAVPPLTSNEINLLELIAHRILLLEMGNTPRFTDLLTTVYSISYKSLIANSLEANTTSHLGEFCMDIYNFSTAFKSAHFILFAPLAAAMALAGISDPLAFANIREMTTHIAIMYQIQEDLMNFCDAKISENEDDIQNGRCTWFIIQAMSLADANQRLALQNLYGTRHGREPIKKVYMDLGIPALSAKAIEHEFRLALKRISNLPNEIPGLGLRMLATSVFKRMGAYALSQTLT